MILSIAWRNLWRNKVRSIIVLAAVAIGLFAGVFSVGFMNGLFEMRLKSAIKTETSHIQVHKKEYDINNDVSLFISESDHIINEISSLEEIIGVSRRVISEGMISTAHGSKGVRLMGIEPEREKSVTDIFDKIILGDYLENNDKRIPRVLVGESLAEDLKLKLNSKLTVNMVDVRGDVSAKLFKVCGIFRTSNTGYDEMTVFVNREDLIQQLGLDATAAHEIAMYLTPEAELEDVKAKVVTIASDHEVKIWKEISKELAMMADSGAQLMYIFVMIIMLALTFGIINTMLMVVLERRKELGMLMAVGMNRLRVFWMIVLESVFLSLSGGIIGILIGYIVLSYYETHPINLDMFHGVQKFGFSTEVYTSTSPDMLIGITFMVIVLGIVSSLYPARKATKLNPADSIRTD